MKTQLLFDLESTGLLRRGSTIHCMVMRDAVDSSTHVFDHQPERALIQGIKQLEEADVIIGHNIMFPTELAFCIKRGRHKHFTFFTFKG